MKLFLMANSAVSAWVLLTIVCLALLIPHAASAQEDSYQQWMIGANGSGHIFPVTSDNTERHRYNIKNQVVRKFLQYEKQIPLSVNLGWTNNASAQTATKRAKWFFVRENQRDHRQINYGEPIAIGWGDGKTPFIHYSKRKIGINLDWSKKPVFEWVFLGGELGTPILRGQDWVVLFNLKHEEPMMYFDRTKGGDIGWPDSSRWYSPWAAIKKAARFTERNVIAEFNQNFVVCKGMPDCVTRLKAYRIYMYQMRSGATLHKLPSTLITELQPHFGSIDLQKYRYGKLGIWQPEGNATTDCWRTIYSTPSMVEKIKNNNFAVRGEFEYMLHEISHYSQCQLVGGRMYFAKMWFSQVAVSVINEVFSGEMPSIDVIHDSMPMEVSAETNAVATCKLIPACNRLP